MLLHSADSVIAISAWIKEQWRNWFAPGNQPNVIHNGLEFSMTVSRVGNEQREHPMVFGMASRLAVDKGIDTFIRVAAAIVRKRSSSVFRIAGEGAHHADLEALAARSGVTIHFDGFYSDISQFWREIDIGMFTAPAEPFGLRLLEPLAFGCAVLAFRNNTGSDEILDRCPSIPAFAWNDIDTMANFAAALTREQCASFAFQGLEEARTAFALAHMERAVRDAYSGLRNRRGR
jgi:glycosyltransferase involved in cell wall biosynthesis